jgi:hypothetical protein
MVSGVVTVTSMWQGQGGAPWQRRVLVLNEKDVLSAIVKGLQAAMSQLPPDVIVQRTEIENFIRVEFDTIA